MLYPGEVTQAAVDCSELHPSDIDAAVDCWFSKVSEMPSYEDWIESLVRTAGRSMIHDVRHHKATAIKNRLGEFGGPAKVMAGSETATLAMASCFDYPIDGRRLGDLLGSELLDVANDQEAKSEGFRFNAVLCRSIYAKMPKRKDAHVQDALKEEAVNKLFRGLKGDNEQAA